MATQQTYLELINRVLRRITQAEITTVAGVTGQAKIISNLINEAQNELYTETNWYTLYATRTFSTVAATETYAVATDFGRNIDLIDMTNNLTLMENSSKFFDIDDPQDTDQGNPIWFSIQGANYRLYPIPAGIYTIRDRYWKVPAILSGDTDTSILPLDAENCIIQWSLYKMLEYLNKFEAADRSRIEFERMLVRAKASNLKILDNMNIMQAPVPFNGIAPPRFPSTYGARYY
ncbi:MAG: hypothetical protein KGJ89_05060 [Patescibacteria group bacterium]|nr:hypothetical protein [Patescibacteria group bacterium]MDE2227291.1 hypothetical protein [Patescibacteria group bacterium]